VLDVPIDPSFTKIQIGYNMYNNPLDT